MKKLYKKEIVDTCEECPYFDEIIEDDIYKFCCRYGNTKLIPNEEYDIPPLIPEFCPLVTINSSSNNIIKKINLIIKDTCKECLHLFYNTHIDDSGHPGYDCGYKNGQNEIGRIVNEWDVNENYNSNPKGWPPIPCNCPLEDIS